MKSKEVRRNHVKKTLARISKSIQFTEQVVGELGTLAKELGMTRLKDGKEEGDVSKIARRLVEYGLANKQSFKDWTIGNTGNGRKAHKAEKEPEKIAA
jgi:hypothetical protein